MVSFVRVASPIIIVRKSSDRQNASSSAHYVCKSEMLNVRVHGVVRKSCESDSYRS